MLYAATIAQYQCMTHFGINGFGTITAFSNALRPSDDNKQLKTAVEDMYRAGELMTELAEAAVNVEAAVE